MGEIFERVAPVQSLAWTGERLTSETGGQVEIEHLHRYFFARTLCRGFDVLDIAAGEGYGAALLAQTARSVVGVEISPDAVEHARSTYVRPNLRYEVGDARVIPLADASIDVVVSFETIEHFFEHEQFIAEVRRILRPDGCLIISSPERDIYSPVGAEPNPFHVHELTRNEFGSLLQRSFRHVSLYGQRPLLGAALVPESKMGEMAPFITFERRNGQLFEVSEGLPRAIYLVAVASDTPKLTCQGSLYIETAAVEGIFSNARAAQEQIASLTARLTDEGAYAQRVQGELNRRDDQLAGHVQQSGAQINQLTSELQRTQDELAAHVVWADTEINVLKETLSAERTWHHQTREALVAAEARIRAIWNSASWRVTAPVRFVLRRMPFLHRIIAGTPRAMLRLFRGQPLFSTPRQDFPPSNSLDITPTDPPVQQASESQGVSRLPAPQEILLRLERLVPAATAEEAIPRRPGGERLLCYTHVVPFPPRAGNEYRIHQMLRFLAEKGRNVLLVLCPLPGDPISDAHAQLLASFYPGLIICSHDGLIRHNLEEGDELLDALAGRRVRDVGVLLGEHAVAGTQAARLIGLQRTFCPDTLVELLIHLDRAYSPTVILAEYVFMTRAFPLLRSGSLKLVDTIDAFSSKAALVERQGVTDGLALDDAEEAELLGRADIVIAIQDREAELFVRLGAPSEVITVGVDFVVRSAVPPVAEPRLLMVGSKNPMNVQGLQDFLRLCWPLVRESVPEAELHVVGSVGTGVGFVPEGVLVLGQVEDLRGEYEWARLVINPVAAGTGLKIKTVEALSHLRSVVCWPAGSDGLSGPALEHCFIADDWSAFARQIVQILRDDALATASPAERQGLAAHFDAERVYAPLLHALEREP